MHILSPNNRASPKRHPPYTYSSSYKYLGITLNPSLTLTDHVSNIIRTVYGKINTLSYLRRTFGQPISLQIYKTTILPLMEYSNAIFTLLNKRDRNKLQRLQNRALKIIYSSRITPEEAHVKAKLSTLESRANNQLKSLMYCRSRNPNDYPILSNTGPTRANNKIRFEVPRPRTERFKMYPFYQGTLLWDTLSPSTQRSETSLTFKNRIKPRL